MRCVYLNLIEYNVFYVTMYAIYSFNKNITHINAHIRLLNKIFAKVCVNVFYMIVGLVMVVTHFYYIVLTCNHSLQP